MMTVSQDQKRCFRARPWSIDALASVRSARYLPVSRQSAFDQMETFTSENDRSLSYNPTEIVGLNVGSESWEMKET